MTYGILYYVMKLYMLIINKNTDIYKVSMLFELTFNLCFYYIYQNHLQKTQ